ncbi:MAG: RnfH family protein [Gammaproteobacteria bacterium]
MPQPNFPIEIALLADPAIPQLISLLVEPGTTIGDALLEAGISPDGFTLGKAGSVAKREDTLMAGDRIELLPPLIITPEAARKLRAAKKKKRDIRDGL